MITISKPQISESDGRARLSAVIDVDGNARTVWFEVDSRYTQYLCAERSDGFVAGVLGYAMKNGHDIRCQAPVGEYLYYNLTEHFIPALYNNGRKLHHTKIEAGIDPSVLENAGAVGTGMSRGIDSLHALLTNSDPQLPGHMITHLAFNNVGSHAGEGEESRKLFSERSERSRQFAEEYGYEYVEGDSNIGDEFLKEHYFDHIYSNMFAIFCLQKLYKIYYYSSASPYSTFDLTDNDLHTPDRYELLTVFCFSTDTLKIYSEGSSVTRFEKTQKVMDYQPSYKYLDVCLRASKNCGVCHKCRRTIMDLYALGALDRYGEVFDLDFFNKNKSWYLAKAYGYRKAGNAFYTDSCRLLKKEITLPVKIKAIPTYIAQRIENMKDGPLRRMLKKRITKIEKKRSQT